MFLHCKINTGYYKRFLLAAFMCLGLAACSVNPATGRNQFTGLMSPQQENVVGAQEHQKAIQAFGLYDDAAIQSYVNNVGQRVVAGTERGDVQYKFYVIDSPIVNAFALPGGYIYISRGLLALANSEAELAGVLGHEAGHITARHTAERYSQSVATGLGAAVLSAALNSPGASRAIGVGSDLFLKSYSRSQESEADSLGLRYLSRSGYDVYALPGFLTSLQREEQLGDNKNASRSYFSTHPATGDRVAVTSQQAAAYESSGNIAREDYLRRINGLAYGDSAEQGFVRGNQFLHPGIGFGFDVPQGYKITNQPDKVVAINEAIGAAVIVDSVASRGLEALAYLSGPWANGKTVADAERININGLPAATGVLRGTVNGAPAFIRLVAIEWSPTQIFRMQLAMPQNVSQNIITDLQRTTYSFRRLTDRERSNAKPARISLITARAGDTAETLGQNMAVLAPNRNGAALFRVLNGLGRTEQPKTGQLYKTVIN